jgi:hypothetical protein
MKIGIMQPYFFPYIGYFQLIKATDQWVVFDTPQYIRKGWVNRNRILSPSKDSTAYITVPVSKQPRDTSIKDTLISNHTDWQTSIVHKIMYYERFAPFYSEVMDLVKNCLEYETQSLSELNIHCLKKVCEYLSLPFDYTLFSANRMGIESVNAPDEWALQISISNGADTYINPPGGKDFFSKTKYENAGIKLCFLNSNCIFMPQIENTFIPNLSIIDVMMFNSPAKINELLEDYVLE